MSCFMAIVLLLQYHIRRFLSLVNFGNRTYFRHTSLIKLTWTLITERRRLASYSVLLRHSLRLIQFLALLVNTMAFPLFSFSVVNVYDSEHFAKDY